MNIDFNPIIQFLNDMAEKLTPSAQRVFELAVRQTIIDGVMSLFGWLFMLIVTVLGWKCVFGIGKMLLAEEINRKEKDNLDIAHVAFFMASLAITVPLFYVTFSWIPNAINSFINPEYQTLLKLLELIK